MGFRERHPGWLYPEVDPDSEATTDMNNMAQIIMSAIPCPRCGALVPLQAAPRHIQFHRDLVASGATPPPN